MTDYSAKKIGIWGWGVAGKSVALFILQKKAIISVFDAQELTQEDQDFLKKSGISYDKTTALADFLKKQDYIFPSPGIDLRPFAQYAKKWLSELDLFAQAWHKPSIAITGTAGKTSLTSLLSQLLVTYKLNIVTGGNIGVGLLDLLPDQDNLDYAVLELSSYQLERSTLYAPDYAILTNLYANHLDRHGSLEDYFQAKYNLFAYQNNKQKSILPLELYAEFRKKTNRAFILFAAYEPTEELKTKLSAQDKLYYLDAQKNIVFYYNKTITVCLPAEKVPALSYKNNWVILYALLSSLGLSQEKIEFLLGHTSFELPAYRGELVAIKHDISYYNDSKSTLFESTLAAVEKFSGKPLILLLGGLSKGVDRTVLIPHLAKKVLFVSCFGKEAAMLYQACKKAGIQAGASQTLEEAFVLAQNQATKNMAILFSPAGSSFDLFKNYQERGAAFNLLVHSIK